LAEKFKAQSVSCIPWLWNLNEVPRLQELGTTLQYPRSPFTTEADSAPVGAAGPTFLQANYDLKDKLKSVVNLLEFYGSLPLKHHFRTLRKLAGKFLSLFGSNPHTPVNKLFLV